MDVGPLQTSISWNYTSQSSPAVNFVLQGFSLSNITSNQLSSPLVVISSLSPKFHFPSQEFSGENIYWKIFASSETGVSFSDYYTFESLFANGSNTQCIVVLSTSTITCITLPDVGNEIPYFIWPKSSHSRDGYCFCLLIPGHFARCALECSSVYQFVYNSSSSERLCYYASSEWRNNTLKTYLAIQYDPCFGGCIITSFISSYIFSRHSTSSMSLSLPSILNYQQQNYSTTLNKTIHFNVFYEPSANYQLPSWRHNGFAINNVANVRINVTNDGGLTIHATEAADAGVYTLIACNRIGCESAHFVLFISFLAINSSIALSDDTTMFCCTAMGFPSATFIHWQTGTGTTTSSNATTTSNNPNNTATFSIFVKNEACRRHRGYTCVFSNNGVPNIVREVQFHCTPGPPSDVKIYYMNETQNLCFDAYTHPEYLVETYYIELTEVSLAWQQLILYANYSLKSQCISLSNYGICNLVNVSVTAENLLGNSSTLTANNINKGENNSCYNHNIIIQLKFEGVINCDDWILIEKRAKILEVTEKLSDVIQHECNCPYSVSAFREAIFYCCKESPNYVTYQAFLVAQSEVTETDIIKYVEKWIIYKGSLVILDNLLIADTNCPVVISTIDESQCPAFISNFNTTILIIGLSSSTAIVLLLFMTTVCIAIQRRASKKVLKSADPIYEEVAESLSKPVYEEVLPTNVSLNTINCDCCDAYMMSSNRKALYEDVADITGDNNFHFKQCCAYGTSK